MRIIIAGLLGAVAMFIWATIAHLSPLATIGVQTMPAEGATLQALHLTLGDQPGLYVFPSPGKFPDGPSGVLGYQPPGHRGLMPVQLGLEFALEVVESLLAAVALGLTIGALRRLGVAVVIGLIAAMVTNLSYWNWYGFSLDYSLANALIELIKFVVAGLVITAFLAWRRGPPRRRA